MSANSNLSSGASSFKSANENNTAEEESDSEEEKFEAGLESNFPASLMLKRNPEAVKYNPDVPLAGNPVEKRLFSRIKEARADGKHYETAQLYKTLYSRNLRQLRDPLRAAMLAVSGAEHLLRNTHQRVTQKINRGQQCSQVQSVQTDLQSGLELALMAVKALANPIPGGAAAASSSSGGALGFLPTSGVHTAVLDDAVNRLARVHGLLCFITAANQSATASLHSNTSTFASSSSSSSSNKSGLVVEIDGGENGVARDDVFAVSRELSNLFLKWAKAYSSAAASNPTRKEDNNKEDDGDKEDDEDLDMFFPPQALQARVHLTLGLNYWIALDLILSRANNNKSATATTTTGGGVGSVGAIAVTNQLRRALFECMCNARYHLLLSDKASLLALFVWRCHGNKIENGQRSQQQHMKIEASSPSLSNRSELWLDVLRTALQILCLRRVDCASKFVEAFVELNRRAGKNTKPNANEEDVNKEQHQEQEAESPIAFLNLARIITQLAMAMTVTPSGKQMETSTSAGQPDEVEREEGGYQLLQYVIGRYGELVEAHDPYLLLYLDRLESVLFARSKSLQLKMHRTAARSGGGGADDFLSNIFSLFTNNGGGGGEAGGAAAIGAGLGEDAYAFEKQMEVDEMD